MNARHHSRTQGFTLVELLVVIAIIAVLAAILIPTFSGAQKKPYDTAALQCGRAIVVAQTAFKVERSTYSATLSPLGEDVAEVCQSAGMRVSPHSAPANNPGATVSMGMDASNDNYSFQVFHPNGSGYYKYWKTSPSPVAAGDRLNQLVRW